MITKVEQEFKRLVAIIMLILAGSMFFGGLIFVIGFFPALGVCAFSFTFTFLIVKALHFLYPDKEEES